MMGLELVVSVEHFNADGWADSDEYRTRYSQRKNAGPKKTPGLYATQYRVGSTTVRDKPSILPESI